MAAAASRKRPAPEEARPPSKRARYKFSKIDDYELLEQLGEGAFGVVFRARHRRTGEAVAVKRIRGGGGCLDAVVREAGCLAACRGHPSVVQIRDVASDAATGDLYLVTELVDGPSLRDWLTRPLPEAVARGFMRQLLGAAARMHAAPMVHRDIKPENVLVGGFGGELKICDFGCATPAKTPYLGEGCVGTLQYSAPEQLEGGQCYGAAVDMWALGCVMAELLVGAPLFTADTEAGVLQQIEELRDGIEAVGLEAVDDLLELSPAGREVLAGLLSFEPGERLTATEALRHRWLTEEKAECPVAANAEFPGFVPLFSAA